MSINMDFFIALQHLHLEGNCHFPPNCCASRKGNPGNYLNFSIFNLIIMHQHIFATQ